MLAIHHYVAGEIDNLDRAWTSAEHHYREALRLSESSGATFIHALAAVGLVSVHAASGETASSPPRLRRSSSTTGNGPAAGPSSGPPFATSPICSTSSTTTTAHHSCAPPPTRRPKRLASR